jgi:hypothetical protein
MITFLTKLSVVWGKNANFFAKFSAKIFLNHNIGPRCRCSVQRKKYWKFSAFPWRTLYVDRCIKSQNIQTYFYIKRSLQTKLRLYFVIGKAHIKNTCSSKNTNYISFNFRHTYILLAIILPTFSFNICFLRLKKPLTAFQTCSAFECQNSLILFCRWTAQSDDYIL